MKRNEAQAIEYDMKSKYIYMWVCAYRGGGGGDNNNNLAVQIQFNMLIKNKRLDNKIKISTYNLTSV